jgi:hypothetical protein
MTEHKTAPLPSAIAAASPRLDPSIATDIQVAVLEKVNYFAPG